MLSLRQGIAGCSRPSNSIVFLTVIRNTIKTLIIYSDFRVSGKFSYETQLVCPSLNVIITFCTKNNGYISLLSKGIIEFSRLCNMSTHCLPTKMYERLNILIFLKFVRAP